MGRKVVLQRTAKKCTKNYNAHAQSLYCSFNLLFSGAAVVVVVFLSSLKPRLNDRNMRANVTYRNIVGRKMLLVFGHPVATCCDVLGVVGSNVTIFKLELTTPNMPQHIATRWPNAHNMLRLTMLRYVALACCDRLAGHECNMNFRRIKKTKTNK